MRGLHLPQLRVLVTDYCDSNCIYCRPSGEGNLDSRQMWMSYGTAVSTARLYRELGGREIKISGGDPVFWPHLSEYIRVLKNTMCYERVEAITRSTRVVAIADRLEDARLDVLNFSLDTTCPDRYGEITGKKNFDAYMEAVSACASRFHCKINMVILNDTTLEDIDNMIRLCRELGVAEFKLLDLIDDLVMGPCKEPKTEIFDAFYRRMDEECAEKRTIFQGALGHPMLEYTMSDGLKIICKDASRGAWYCPSCEECPHFPCHDAIMAIRVTPANTFQLCLLNAARHWKFDEATMEAQMKAILREYQEAYFVA